MCFRSVREPVYLEFMFVCIVSIFAAPKDCARPLGLQGCQRIWSLRFECQSVMVLAQGWRS